LRSKSINYRQDDAMRLRRILQATISAALVSSNAHAGVPADARALCDGLPRLAVRTAPGFCVGVVATGMKSPRGLQVLPNGDIIVADMGAWQPGRGRIWLLKQRVSQFEKSLLFEHLDRTNSVAIAPNGAIYVGMVGRVARIGIDGGKPAMTDIIGGAARSEALPAQGRHLLPSLQFDTRGDLYVNVGSSSDHCEGQNGEPPAPRCAQREGAVAVGVIRKYAMSKGVARSSEVYAKGLRNSMAMAFDQQGRLWQGENGRDGINAAMPELKNDDELPHDELNLVERGVDYGWPYCYDDNQSSPEYPAAKCSRYRAPVRLLPAHAAPLGMVFYRGSAYPAKFAGALIISYHGYRQHGHRVVALLPDRDGEPRGNSVDLVTGSRQNGKNFGAPVGVSLGPDGKLYITDDHAGIVVRLSYDSRSP
jgi:glucose/arabinose dehydrogenase